ncbi:MAG: Flp family type IVb pilin [Neomegalonema sp.]|nr:Flp family type IVb pilin [Neomegalonema sp.]
MFSKFIKDESGATAIEYTLLAALIAVALIGALQLLEDQMTKTLGKVQSTLKDATK